MIQHMEHDGQASVPVVSIVVAIYNVADKLEACIRSIVQQTEKNIEIILVDDGSKDASGEICDRFAREDSRIRVLHQSNAGVSVARNNGMALAVGQWIMFVDGDDWLESTGVESLLAAVGEDSDCDIVSGSHCWHRSDDLEILMGSELPPDTRYEYDLREVKDQIIGYILGTGCPPELTALGCNLASACGKLYRSAYLQAHGVRYLPNLRRSEDYVFNLYAQHHARKLLIINETIYHYRIWGGSVSEQISKNQVPMERFFAWVQEVEGFLKTCGYDDALRAFFVYGRVKEVAVIWIDQYRAGTATWRKAAAEIRKMKDRGWHVALANPYYSWKDRIFAVLLRFRLYRLFWIVRCVYST